MNPAANSPWPVEVSIIIPVFNKADLTEQCLAAIEPTARPISHEVIVVDNASTDRTTETLARFANSVRAVRNEANRGFAAACNQGAALARGQHLLFLNNDTVPCPGWLEPLVREFRRNPEVAMAGAKLLYPDGTIQHAGVSFGRETRSPFHPYRYSLSEDPRPNRRRELQAVTAACVLVRREWFARCGGFNEEFRNGYEDLDLCLKIRSQGGLIVYQPQSTVFHLESQSPGRMKHDGSNRALFFRKWADWLLADEDAYYFADDLKAVQTQVNGLAHTKLVPIRTPSERAQWELAARLQRLAAEGKQTEVRQIIERVNDWPADPAVRRWASALAFRQDLKSAGMAHLRKSLEIEPDEAALLVLARQDPAEAARLLADPKLSPAARAQIQGQQALARKDYAAATRAFETALLEGISPREALFGLGLAAIGAGDAAAARQCCNGILARRNPDNMADHLLERLAAAGAETQPEIPAPVETRPEVPVPAPPANTSAPCPETAGSPAVATGESAPDPETDPNQPLVSILILALNQLDHTRKCLQSIDALTPQSHELILVDNGSTDGTPDFLRQWQAAHPNCTVIRNASNRGFAAGNNQALSLARGRYVVLLNNDTVVTNGWLENMLALFERFPDTGISGPMSNRASGPQLVREPGYQELSEMPAFAARWCAEHRGQFLELSRAVGFCLLARREVVARIGGLDDTFGSGNFEDDDFCIRACLAGYRVRIALDSYVHHTGGQTFAGARIDYAQAMRRNWDYFRTKWQLPPEVTLNTHYPVPKLPPPGLSLKSPLPSLRLTHEPAGDRFWREATATPSEAKPASSVPPVARLGNLDAARSALASNNPPAAWKAAAAAVQVRPFHPEAWLLMADIALAARAGAAARQCARQARDLAPKWKDAARFLQRTIKGNEQPEWLVLPEDGESSKSQAGCRLSVCLIAKNEEKFLGRALESIKPLASQIVVVDTGSTDRTIEIAKEHGAEVRHFQWCDDFSAARNAALQYATGDWVLMLDADEVLPADQHENLRRDLACAEVIAWRMPLINSGQESHGASPVPRLFRNAPGAFFQSPIHEQIFPSLLALSKPWGMACRVGSARLTHYGYTPELMRDRNKIERNLKLLDLAVAQMPDNSNLIMNLGLELVRSGNLETGLERYRQAFRLMSAQPPAEVVPELREVLLTQFTCHLYKAGANQEVIEVLASPLAKNGGLTASLHYALGLAHFKLNEDPEAAAQMRLCLAKRREPALGPINTDILSATPHHCLAVSLKRMGDNAGAERAFQDGLQAADHVDELKLDYAKFLVDQQRPVDALGRLHEVVLANPKQAAAWRLGAQITLGDPQFLEVARDWTAEALQQLPEDDALTALRAEALLLSQDTTGALPLWKSLLARDCQPRTQAALILCAVADDVAGDFVPAPGETMVVSRAFLDWYRRILAFGARELIVRLNRRTDLLARSLPEAAQILRGVAAEAGRPAEPAPCSS